MNELTAELVRVKSGYADWACNPKTIWPQWAWERLGALAMIMQHRLTQGHVEFLMRTAGSRRLNEWYKLLRMLRMYGTVRAD